MHKSYWVESTPKTNYLNISENIDTDVLIIGGGITGILTAYMLSESGLNISIVEANKMAMGVTAMRLLMIGIPYIFSSSSPTGTRRSAAFVILS